MLFSDDHAFAWQNKHLIHRITKGVNMRNSMIVVNLANTIELRIIAVKVDIYGDIGQKGYGCRKATVLLNRAIKKKLSYDSSTVVAKVM